MPKVLVCCDQNVEGCLGCVEKLDLSKAPERPFKQRGRWFESKGKRDSHLFRQKSSIVLYGCDSKKVAVPFWGFGDLVGSTHLSQRLDAEDLRSVVRAYQEVASRKAEDATARIFYAAIDGKVVATLSPCLGPAELVM